MIVPLSFFALANYAQRHTYLYLYHRLNKKCMDNQSIFVVNYYVNSPMCLFRFCQIRSSSITCTISMTSPDPFFLYHLHRFHGSSRSILSLKPHHFCGFSRSGTVSPRPHVHSILRYMQFPRRQLPCAVPAASL